MCAECGAILLEGGVMCDGCNLEYCHSCIAYDHVQGRNWCFVCAETEMEYYDKEGK